MSKALVIKGADFSANALDQITYDVIHAESVSISQSTASFNNIGETMQLTCSVVPSTAEDPIRWVSSDAAVATVSNGLVTIVGVGSCTITVSAGTASASCAVSVIVEIADLGRYPMTRTNAANATNFITNFATLLGSDNTDYNDRVVLCDSEPTFNNLTIPYDFAIQNSETGIYEMYKTRQDLIDAGQTGMLRVLDNIGHPIPILLPPNCTKIRCVAPNGHYGAYPLFYQHDVPAYPAGSGTTGKAHFSPKRCPEQPEYSYTFDYTQSKDFSVPDGYDSVSVMWKTDGVTGTVDPADMTKTQLAEFKIYAL